MVDLPADIPFEYESLSVISWAYEQEVVHGFGRGVTTLEAVWGVAAFELE